MTWDEIRSQYPGKWLLVEAVRAHTSGDNRIVDDLRVIGTYADSLDAWRQYNSLHHDGPFRELYVLHSDRVGLDIRVRHELPVRGIRIRG